MSDKINEKVYPIRRGILRALDEAVIDGDINNAAPMTVDFVIEIRANAALKCSSQDDIRKEWANLKNFGYIEAMPGFNGQYCKISQKGREQLNIEFPQDFYIHGPAAIK
ncbi:MAG: hypothetical protein NT118_08615 [Lentisphaerae bacterium]|nr:hypothetical protein [Lentisphaerota bacterium]